MNFLVEEFDPTKEYVVNKYLLYPVLREKQLAILFGITGEGKSILANLMLRLFMIIYII